MLNTSTFTTDAVGDDEPIVIPVYCNRINISQIAGDTDYTFRPPKRTSDAVRYISGAPMELPGPFYKNQTIGFIAAISGAATFQLLCTD